MATGTDQKTFEYYVFDLGMLLREAALKAKAERDAAVQTADREFADGRLMAYYHVVSLMQNQAFAFGLSFQQVGLEGINPDHDLI